MTGQGLIAGLCEARDLRIVNLTWRCASHFDLDRLLTFVVPVKVIHFGGSRTRDFGFCDLGTGAIYIRTHTLHAKPRPLAVETLADSIGHELAHLMEHRHGRAHRTLTSAMASWLRANWGHDFNAMPRALEVIHE